MNTEINILFYFLILDMKKIQYSLWLLYLFLKCIAQDRIRIDFEESTSNVRRLKRFWTNTGFSPLVNDLNFFESNDLSTNLEIIGSLPNNGLKNVRIHWLLDLLIHKFNDNDILMYDFSKLDNFLNKLINDWNLVPTIEFMTSHKFKRYNKEFWRDYAYEIIMHYIGYNKLNFSLSEYNDYIFGLNAAFNRLNSEHSSNKMLKLRGPAGLFKDIKKHKFCWIVLEICNQNISSCPVDILTFHRKGNGSSANEVIDSTLNLLQEISKKYPKLSKMKFSNTEADPKKKWSEPRDFQADTRYAVILSEIILQHWKAMFDRQMSNLESISHDNSFMNYYPFIFDQRTLLARFQINNTRPKHLQFIRKPVFTALGLMSNLGKYASNVRRINNISYVVSVNNNTEQFFSSILLTSHVNNEFYMNNSATYEFMINNLPKRNDLMVFIEAIDNERTNPSNIYDRLNRPKYPDVNELEKMRNSQGPFTFEEPSKIVNGKFVVNQQLKEPFVVNIRICSKNAKNSNRIQNLRIRKINDQEIILFWTDSVIFQRCTKTYEIYFKYGSHPYKLLSLGHIPFLYHQFKHTIPGCFKVLSKDFFNRVSKLSKEVCNFNNINRK
ncbi:unnamed protein product [Chironomus riparius]|uniref:Glycosyl hydrolases family 39 N-terminal catalytic domain-containing protein n=1 Tax=Chironomus riparius TaxID=315576 RepID=A0A9N9RXZ2_9DIPT|nr:unnamed protein product [Chironomus riparius]